VVLTVGAGLGGGGGGVGGGGGGGGGDTVSEVTYCTGNETTLVNA